FHLYSTFTSHFIVVSEIFFERIGSSLRKVLPEPPVLYTFSEPAKSGWRYNLHGPDPTVLPARLARLHRSDLQSDVCCGLCPPLPAASVSHLMLFVYLYSIAVASAKQAAAPSRMTSVLTASSTSTTAFTITSCTTWELPPSLLLLPTQRLSSVSSYCRSCRPASAASPAPNSICSSAQCRT
ncbi:hypothetical protein B296_00033165, partial [Ensete ventricosum]